MYAAAAAGRARGSGGGGEGKRTGAAGGDQSIVGRGPGTFMDVRTLVYGNVEPSGLPGADAS